MNELEEFFGDVISVYSRSQAIEDGFLIDLTQFPVCREHYKYPIACTSTVWDIIERAVNNPKWCNDYVGVLHDILWMSRACASHINETTVLFPVIITGAGKQKNYKLKMVCGPGDNAEPVMTLMLPEED